MHYTTIQGIFRKYLIKDVKASGIHVTIVDIMIIYIQLVMSRFYEQKCLVDYRSISIFK